MFILSIKVVKPIGQEKKKSIIYFVNITINKNNIHIIIITY